VDIFAKKKEERLLGWGGGEGGGEKGLSPSNGGNSVGLKLREYDTDRKRGAWR